MSIYKFPKDKKDIYKNIFKFKEKEDCDQENTYEFKHFKDSRGFQKWLIT